VVSREEARVFGEVAELYDALRPGYPNALVDAVLASVSEPRRALEAGAGTGKATVVLAERGVEVEAIEPDRRMAAIARRRVKGLSVEVRELRFEDWTGPPGQFDLVVCAQAWHWIDAARGAAVATRALREDGALAVWWTRPRAVPGTVLAAVQDAYRQVAPALVDRTSLLVVRPGVDVPAPLPGFGPWRSSSFPWTHVYDAENYAQLIQTQGDHRLLADAQLAELLTAVKSAIGHAGNGRIEYRFSTDLSVARPIAAD
jgi:SAM-dependent methyltransferase